MPLIQIVPRLPPTVEGVGSYAEALAGALRQRCGIATRFVAMAPAERTPEALTAALEAETLGSEDNVQVLLHYASYGYQVRGCPAWLIRGLARWKQRGGGRRLVTMFHEVWATGPPWRSSFWLSPVQRRLAASLARLSGGIATSLALYGQMIRPWTGGREVRVLPVFSTVGEPAAAAPLAGRAPRLIVFGGAGVRSRAWGRELPDLAAACAALEIEEILDVGPAAPAPARIGPVPVRRLGVLPAAEVGALLSASRAGFLAYPPDFLPKSTIFAAYCAHGVLPVCAWRGRTLSQEPLPPFWQPGAGADPVETAGRARAWYAEHSLDRQAEVFKGLLA